MIDDSNQESRYIVTTHILQGNVILPERVLERGKVVIEDGIIQAVASRDSTYRPTEDLGQHYIAPGFIDVHTHGIGGADTMDADGASLSTMALRYAAHGVTGFLPTTITQDLNLIHAAIRSARAHVECPDADRPVGARVLGIHLEGPWISATYKGAQNPKYILDPSPDVVSDILAGGGGHVKVVTLAPEVRGAEQAVAIVRQYGAQVSIGHSGATYDQTLLAIAWGATRVTHCFNGMTGLHHRQPGVVGAALRQSELMVELIADGVHVHPTVMQFLLQCAGRERVMLITDSISATELADDTYDLGGQEVHVRDGQARLADGTLAGSTLTMDRAIWNLIHLCDVPLHDAVYMASAVPAASLGLGDRKGQIRVGYDADLLIMDADVRPERTLIGGTACPVERNR